MEIRRAPILDPYIVESSVRCTLISHTPVTLTLPVFYIGTQSNEIMTHMLYLFDIYSTFYITNQGAGNLILVIFVRCQP